MNKKKLIWLAIIIAVFYIIYVSFIKKPDNAATAQGSGVPVATVKLETTKIERTEKLPGRTNAYRQAEIRPQINGIIIKRNFTEGAMVKEGDQLYQIDPSLYNAAYVSAKADLQRADANEKSVAAKASRYEKLVRINAVSKQEYDDVKAALAQAEADVAVADAKVATAKINLDYTKVYSPIAGRIGKSSVTEGALVTANQAQALTQVTQLDPIYVDMTQSSSDMMRINSQFGGQMDGRKVNITLENGDTYDHDGTLQFSDVTVDETTGSVQLRALFPNPDGKLLPGLFVQAEVMLGEEEALLIPQKAAIRDKSGQLTAWVVNEKNVVNPVPIVAAREYKDQWVVTQGVSAGDVVVTEGFQKIKPGDTVAPAKESTDTKPTAEKQG